MTAQRSLPRRLLVEAIRADDPGGSGRHAVQMVSHLAREFPSVEVLAVVPAPISGLEEQNIRQVELPVRRRSIRRLCWILEGHRLARSLGADALYCPSNFGILSSPCPYVVTVQDLSPLACPRSRDTPLYEGLLYRTVLPLTLRRARFITVPSESTRRDVLKWYRLPDGRVRRIYHGVTGLPDPETGPEPEAPYLLFAGILTRKKNLEVVLEALRILEDRHGLQVPLKLAGKPGPDAGRVRARASRLGLDRRVEFLGFVPDAELARLYAGALALVFPSLYEGFGLPLAEAMAAGLPFISSDSSSLPEIGGEAGLYASPGAPEEWAEAILRVWTDGALRRRLSERGKERSAEFSWARAAREVMSLFS